MSIFQALLYAIVQGITELFPISSVAHAVILPKLFHWTSDSDPETFLPFVVMLHVGTAIALLLYFKKDWIDFLSSPFQSGASIARKEFLLVIAGTIPAGLIGLIFQKTLQAHFTSVISAGLFLIVNGFVLFLADGLKKKAASRSRKGKEIRDLSYGQAAWIGFLQSFALLPGFSRSGMSMVGGLGAGLRYEEAARFSFLLATPLILAAGVLEIPKLLKHGDHSLFLVALIGGVAAGIAAWLATFFMMRWFNTHEARAMRPFAYYCLVVGILVSIFLR